MGSSEADADTEDVSVEDASTNPSGARLAILSICAFIALVLVGGGVGLFIGASSPSMEDEVEVPAEIAFGETAARATIDTDAPESPTTALAPTTSTSDPVEDSPKVIEEAPASVEVRGVVELGLELAPAESTVAPAEPDSSAADVEFLELPKAVYDRFELAVGDSYAGNIAANDKIGGIFQSVRLTGLGELAPGFVLAPDGTLSGTATECGNWRAQYGLVSTNPATGTSWIEIDVGGCANAG